ncbi:MAG TPA: hypothetical protein VH817_23635 [Thermoleophilaceae bacterium]
MRVALATALAIGVAAAPAAAAAPKVDQLVVFRDGSFKKKTTHARQAAVRVHGRRCAVGAATPLAALITSRVAKIGLKDFGSCSRRPRDASGLFVRKLGRDANSGQDGWVYKVGNKSGTAGAADPTGPFGHGKLRAGARVLWFYCHIQGSSCQRTLAFSKVDTGQPGAVEVHVRAYNDRGKGIPAAGVTVHADALTATTDQNGVARLTPGAGTHTLYADGGGYVRSFDSKVAVK